MFVCVCGGGGGVLYVHTAEKDINKVYYWSKNSLKREMLRLVLKAGREWL